MNCAVRNIETWRGGVFGLGPIPLQRYKITPAIRQGEGLSLRGCRVGGGGGAYSNWEDLEEVDHGGGSSELRSNQHLAGRRVTETPSG